MSLLLLTSGEVGGDVDSGISYLWNVYGDGGVGLTATYKWNILIEISSAATEYKWQIYNYLSVYKFAYYKWQISIWQSREIVYIWDIAQQFTDKVKHTFISAKNIVRFFRRKRLG